MQTLRQRGQLALLDNTEDDTLWCHISGDKGGRSTKILLQIINGTNRHSIKSAKMLGMFEGGKDSRHNIEMAFKPVFDQIRELAADFDLDLDRPHREMSECFFLLLLFIFALTYLMKCFQNRVI